MPLTLVANNADRTVSWEMDAIFTAVEQYLLVTDATNSILDMTRVSLTHSATYADLSSQFPKNHKLIVRLEQIDADGNTLKSPAVTLPALLIPLTPTLVSATGIDNGIVASFTIPQGSPLATKVVVIITDLSDMASIEKTMPSVMVNGSYQVSVTSADMSIIQENSNTTYEVSLVLRNAIGSSGVSNVLSATPSNLPNTPNLESVLSAGSGRATATWSAPSDSSYWTTTAIKLYVYQTSLGESSKTLYSVSPLSSTSQDISNLTNGTSYTFYVTYSNSAGEGEKSNQISFIPYGIPSTAGDFLVNGFQSIGIIETIGSRPSDINISGVIAPTRTPPNARAYVMTGNGATITGYNIYNELNILEKFVPKQELDDGYGQSFYFSKVVEVGKSYTYSCKTVAVSADGNTVLSDALTSTFTIHSSPYAVTNLVATGLNEAISLSWNASVTNGFPIQKYSIRNSNNEELFNTTSTQYLITGLTNGIAQTYKIVAVTQSDRYIANNFNSTVESENSPSATATPHKAPVIDNVSINGLVMTLSITDNGLPASNVVAFAVDATGHSAIIQQTLVNNTVTFSSPLTNIASYMVFVTNSANQMSNIKYVVASS